MNPVKKVGIEMSKSGILQALKLESGKYEVEGHGYKRVMAYIVHGETIGLEIAMWNGKTQHVTYNKDMEILYEDVR